MCYTFQGKTVKEPYPDWVMFIAGLMITAGILPMPIVFILRRCQCLKLDLDIHQGAIRRIDTTVSTKEMIGDVDVSYRNLSLTHTSMAIHSLLHFMRSSKFIIHFVTLHFFPGDLNIDRLLVTLCIVGKRCR
jgi:hypothetical protein